MIRSKKPRREASQRISSLKMVHQMKMMKMKWKKKILKRVLIYFCFYWIAKKLRDHPNSKASKLEERIKRKRDAFLKKHNVWFLSQY